MQLVKQLKATDLKERWNFAVWVQRRLEEDPHFYRNTIFSDEANFHLVGYVNKQYLRLSTAK